IIELRARDRGAVPERPACYCLACVEVLEIVAHANYLSDRIESTLKVRDDDRPEADCPYFPLDIGARWLVSHPTIIGKDPDVDPERTQDRHCLARCIRREEPLLEDRQVRRYQRPALKAPIGSRRPSGSTSIRRPKGGRLLTREKPMPA